MKLETFEGKTPQIAKTAKLFTNALLIGDVTIGEHVGVWYNTTLRGDMAPISIGEGTNIQDGCVIHTNTDMPSIIGKHVTVGHMALIHAATVDDGALIGMGSILLDGAHIGSQALVAAGTVVPPGKKVPPRTLAMGNPMRLVKELTDDDIKGIENNTQFYVDLLSRYQK